jgi:hypothetical protein
MRKRLRKAIFATVANVASQWMIQTLGADQPSAECRRQNRLQVPKIACRYEVSGVTGRKRRPATHR